MSSNATVIAACVTGILLLLSSILVPFVTKRANKADSAADSAKKSAETAEAFTKTARELVQGVNEQLVETKQKCTQCLDELASIRAKDRRRDRELDAIHKALLEIVPLLDVGAEATAMLQATIRAVVRSRYGNGDE